MRTHESDMLARGDAALGLVVAQRSGQRRGAKRQAGQVQGCSVLAPSVAAESDRAPTAHGFVASPLREPDGDVTSSRRQDDRSRVDARAGAAIA